MRKQEAYQKKKSGKLLQLCLYVSHTFQSTVGKYVVSFYTPPTAHTFIRSHIHSLTHTHALCAKEIKC